MRKSSTTAAAAVAVAVLAVTTSAAASPPAGGGRPTTAASATSAPGGCTPTWQVVPSPALPPGITTEGQGKVSIQRMTADAVSPGDVWFSSYLFEYGADQPFVMHSDGRTVTEPPSQPPNASFGLGQTITGGSFDSATDGWVVGAWGTGTSTKQPDAVRWHGGRWTITPLGMPADATAGLPGMNAVATISPDSAWAAGSLVPASGEPAGALIEHWDGTQWSIVPNPDSATPASLQSLTVVSPTDIWAAGYQGYQGTAGSAIPLIEHYDGTSWQVVPTPVPPAAAQPADLTSISADGPDNVWASGVQNAPDQAAGGTWGMPLVEHWDGTAWTVVTGLPDVGTMPGFASGNGIGGVYAASPDDVWVTVDRNIYPGAFLHWDGSTWTAVPQPGLREWGVLYDLNSISGDGPDDIWATGFIEDYFNDDPILTVPQIYHLSCD